MPAGDTTPIPTTDPDLSRAIDPNDSTAAKKMGEVSQHLPESPTSVQDEYEQGGTNLSPGQSRSANDVGQAWARTANADA